MMSAGERAVAAAWRAAAADLGIAVVAPFTLTTPHGAAYAFPALVQGFGAPGGTLICAQERQDALRHAVEQNGYRCVGLCTDDYREYHRELFVWLLDDFEWVGPVSERPAWHTGPLGRASS